MDPSITFDNRFVRELPGDPSTDPRPRQVLEACYSRVQPVKPSGPRLLAVAAEVAELLDFDPELLRSEPFILAFSGHTLLPGMDPFAMCYGGHQFGHWAGQLGDGRAINLGELVNGRNQRWMLQLKGAGPTPYSRHADGFAVLRSSVREFLCSEAMHHLGVPTTRALSLIATGDLVVRDMFYDGRPRREPGAIVCRVAPTFVRFGNFEIFAARRDNDNLRRLIDYVIRTDFPHLGEPTPDAIGAWFEEICKRTATMIVHWMRVGFVHGVMNTDNMSILGQTIDYGPYGWLEDYDPTWTPNTTDAEGRRYCYGQQPQIAYWNLGQLANAIYPVLQNEDWVALGMEAYVRDLQSQWNETMAAKLGFEQWREEDSEIVDALLDVLRSAEIDMTWFYRLLAEYPVAAANASVDPMAHFAYAFYRFEEQAASSREAFTAWLKRYRDRIVRDGTPDPIRGERMHRVNPKVVLRNYLAQQAIDAAEQGDPSEIEKLLDALRRPYDDQPEYQRFAERRPEWARNRPGCSMLSCSS
ncbi:MAG: protein adenylyltransferase SelO [Planctomycetota bacterium]|jgi:uncharacterized protein YdiU (UPF0061 family)